jgi:phosphoenolpyruvate synthase/pyruvate phosphate dikinase
MEIIKEFNRINKNNADIAGGKGASLGEMTQAGISVPQGFVILANVFEEFIKTNNLNIEINTALDSVDIKKIHTIEQASEKIQSLIINATIQEDIKKIILKAFDKLEAKFVAVRSSATSEDSATAAWAGQLDTYLNTAKENLFENIKKCWASLFTPRAIFYRFEQKLNKEKISVAVIIQKMINSEKSGVAFSVHPVTQDINHIIIEAGIGLGEAVVSGQITPDSYTINKPDWKILDKKLKTNDPVLSDNEIIELAKLIKKIEQHYGFPVDIEWAYQNNEFYILQSRPITTLGEAEIQNNQKYDFILNNDWEQIVGRKSPPLRTTLSYEGFYNWFEKRFNRKLDNFFITFFKFEDGKISSDNFINLEKRKEILTSLSKSIENEYDRIVEDIDRFNKLSEGLIKICKKLSDKKILLQGRFILFCEAWRNFAPAYIAPIFLEKILEKKIINDFEDKEIAQKKLMELVTSNVKSELFDIKTSSSDVGDDFFHENHKPYIALLQKLINTRDKRKNAYEKAWDEYSRDFFNELGNATNLNDYIGWVSPYEISGLLKKHKEPKKYEDECLIYFINGKIHIDYNNDFSFIKNKILKIEKTNTFTGNTAYPGKVQGKVRIIMPNDKKEINQGEILVTKMTTPDFIPVMNKASAFVTDEGGITCHAAIVSREMKKPCIIGTKIATQVLKNGDLIEVDADNGIVKKL